MRRSLRLIPLVAIATVLAGTQSAEARGRGIIFITHGDHIAHVADLPQPVQDEFRAAGETVPSVGYIYQHFGVFWLDIWTWNGRLCLYEGDNYDDTATPAQLAELLGVSESELNVPFSYRFPPGLLVLVGGVVVWGGVAWRNNARNQATGRHVRELLEDGRYKRALEIIGEHHERLQAQAAAAQAAGQPAPQAPAGDDGGYADAVQHLVSSGIDRPEAEKNLSLLLAVLAARNAAA